MKTDDTILREWSRLLPCGPDEDGNSKEWVGSESQWDTYNNCMGEEVLTDDDDRPFFWSEDEEKSYKVYLD